MYEGVSVCSKRGEVCGGVYTQYIYLSAVFSGGNYFRVLFKTGRLDKNMNICWKRGWADAMPVNF